MTAREQAARPAPVITDSAHPIALLKRESGVLTAHAPDMDCDACELSDSCHPDFGCPRIDYAHAFTVARHPKKEA